MTGNPADLEPTLDLDPVDRILEEVGADPEGVIALLQALQRQYRYLPRPALERLALRSGIPLGRMVSVASFYNQFRMEPVGEHLVQVCHGTACHVAGAPDITAALRRHLAIPAGADTDPGRKWTVTEVACVGCCGLAPVMVVDGVTYGHLSGESACACLDRSLAAGPAPAPKAPGVRPVLDAESDRWVEVRVGMNSCCMASGAAAVKDALERAGTGRGLPVVVKSVGCVGMCHRVPLVEVVGPGGREEGRLYSKVDTYTAKRIARGLGGGGPLHRLGRALTRGVELLTDDRAWEPLQTVHERDREAYDAFMGAQVHLVTEACGSLGPLDLDGYLARGGYGALQQCGEMTPERIIELVERSGLRGRGGAGFPTGRKWRTTRKAEGETKYVVCNGDEGDPGAFMDRMLLEAFPHRIVEGMAIAALAVGAAEGWFYIRAEYPLAVERIRKAIAQAEERGLLDSPAFGPAGRLTLHVKEGAGAFVCGEETGLLASIEGRRGMPRLRPPYPAVRGLRGRPTNINNVETYGVVPWIVRYGPERFAAMGTEHSKGTKVFALAGRIRRVGMVEVPMGITIDEIVNRIGGGVGEGRTFKAVQIGGPSGGCIPASLGDTPVDFERLGELGAIMGSGGLVVLDDRDCMVDIARYFMEFIGGQSCGKCTFCRVGTKRMLELLEGLCQGRGKAADLEELEALAHRVRTTSLCGLGGTAPNTVLTTLRYFREEVEAHLEGRCPAGRCRELIAYVIGEECHGCTLCARGCPVDAIEARPYREHEIDQEKCVKCGGCATVCPADAVRAVSPVPGGAS